MPSKVQKRLRDLNRLYDHCIAELTRIMLDGQPPEDKDGWKGYGKVLHALQKLGYEVKWNEEIMIIKEANKTKASAQGGTLVLSFKKAENPVDSADKAE